MLIRDALCLCLVWGSWLSVAGCGGRADNDPELNPTPTGGVLSIVTSQAGNNHTVIAPSLGGTDGAGGTTSAFTSSPIGGSTSIGGNGTAFGSTVVVTFGGACAAYYGNTVHTTLVSPALCGNGLMEYTNGEQCDDGNKMPGDGCSSDCRVEPNWNCPPCETCRITIICGNGVVQAGEICDDGNTEDGDGCSSTCKQEPGYLCRPGRRCIAISTCGNGTLDPGEECDRDASIFEYDGDASCSVQCTYWGYCGDGEVQAGEACDEGPDNDSLGCNGCTANCQLGPYCGDGLKDEQCGEVCDEGLNKGDYNSCRPGCTAIGPYCGDNVIQAAFGEECDDGASNGSGTSRCTHACKRYITGPY